MPVAMEKVLPMSPVHLLPMFPVYTPFVKRGRGDFRRNERGNYVANFCVKTLEGNYG
jgi:hypothetical protein